MEANLLPGGLVVDSERKRSYRFKPLTGWLERQIQDSGEKADSLAEQISEVLVNTLDTVADIPADKSVVKSLCTGDRQYLLLKLHEKINPVPEWITCHCSSCNERIQFQLDFRRLPVKEASDEFPQTDIELKQSTFQIRVPTGKDEHYLAKTHDEVLSHRTVLDRLLSQKNKNNPVHDLNEEDISKLDDVLDQMAPQIASSIEVNCPYCENLQDVAIDHYNWLGDVKDLDEEIHTLALHYHWSENEILSLSRNRRKRYLSMIEQSKGGVTGVMGSGGAL